MTLSILGALNLAPSPLVPATAVTQPSGRASSSLHFHLANAGAAALVAASLLLADPALAFRGGGPYGQQVTRGQDLTGKDFSGQTLIKQDFKTSILRQTNFKGANLLGASFFDADLTGADLSDADLRNADFSLANVTKQKHGTNQLRSIMTMSILGALKLAPSPLVPATTATQPSGRASSLHFHLANAGAAALVAASLLLADPAFAFRGGGPYGQQVTRGQDLTGKDFSGQTLIKQDFKTSILRQTNFKGANLLGASFFDADLTGADLSDADLRNADFSLANVTKVNLTNANLEGALVTGNTSFKGSNIYGADFTDVPLRDDQRNYLCKIADGVNTTTGNATKETLFCK